MNDLTCPSVITWTPEMSVGVPELDEDHRVIVSLINQLAEAHNLNDIVLVETVLDRLAVYVDEHFRREEAYMESVGFPGLQAHRHIHHALTAKVEQIRLDFFLGKSDSVGESTLKFLKEWLTQHILVEDMEYHPDRREAA
ncbi:MAG: hemerythrin family protein [Sulfuricella sp.]|nr:hemerythrin family protein [Sulfuricella sp.]